MLELLLPEEGMLELLVAAPHPFLWGLFGRLGVAVGAVVGFVAAPHPERYVGC